ncbi:hypothetical protein WJX81_007335 [Elliptochloris bilobata]|uniref:Methyltransferase type 11 domain-containing protein n=1 Tax=Elliptochloris bilobata TaxID=381761 RepID=A0AAW1QU79_9CHLO
MDKEFDPSNKGHLLATHVLHRGWDAGSILGAALGLDRRAIEERVLKLHHNASQNRVDLYSGAGAGLGTTAAAAAAGPSLWSVLGGAAAGSAVGIVAHMAVPVAHAAELPPGSAPAETRVTWSDAWFHAVWKFMGPRTDKYFGECKAKLFASTPLKGTVLEIGPGHGSTLPYVDKAIKDKSISEYVFFEPNQAMHNKLRECAQMAGLTEGGTAPSYKITSSAAGLPAGAFDMIVSSLVMCSVDDVAESAADLYRWLKPGGTLLFMEHMAHGQQIKAKRLCDKSESKQADPNPTTDTPPARSWGLWVQQTLTPGWKVVGGGCHLDRHTLDSLEATFDSVTVLGVKDSPLAPVIYGTAHKKG